LLQNERLNSVLLFVEVPRQYLSELNRKYSERGFAFNATTSESEAIDLAKSADVLVVARPVERVISAASKCRWIHALSAGVESYLSLETVRKRSDLILTNSAGVYAVSIAEHTMAMILFRTRKIDFAVAGQRKRKWVPLSFESGMGVSPTDLQKKTMGIVGLGHTGLEIARRARPYEMRILGTRKHSAAERLRIEEYRSYVDSVCSQNQLDEMLSDSDVVVNALPLTDETRHLFDADRFSKFKRGSIFVNIGRGETVVEKDLIGALKDGKLDFAALDVFETEPLPSDSPLWVMENVLISPHYAGTSELTGRRAMELFEENLQRYAVGKELLNVVDKEEGY